MHYLLIYTKLIGDKVLPVLAIFISALAVNVFVKVPSFNSVLYRISNFIFKEVALFPHKAKENWSQDVQKSEDRKAIIIPI